MCNEVIGLLSGRKFIIDVITFCCAMEPMDGVCISGEFGAIKGPFVVPVCMCFPALFISLLNTNKVSVFVASLEDYLLLCWAAQKQTFQLSATTFTYISARSNGFFYYYYFTRCFNDNKAISMAVKRLLKYEKTKNKYNYNSQFISILVIITNFRDKKTSIDNI